MKKAILFSLCLLFSVIVTQVVIADNIADKPETVQCDYEADLDLMSVEPVASVALEAPIVFYPVRAVFWHRDVGWALVVINYYNTSQKLKPEHFLPDIRRLRPRCLGASFQS